jgi:hypothetical protein
MKWLLPILLLPAVATATTYDYSVLGDCSGLLIYPDQGSEYFEPFLGSLSYSISDDTGRPWYFVSGESPELSFHAEGPLAGRFDPETGAWSSELTETPVVTMSMGGTETLTHYARFFCESFGDNLYLQGYLVNEEIMDGIVELSLLTTLRFDGPRSSEVPEPGTWLLMAMGVLVVIRHRSVALRLDPYG